MSKIMFDHALALYTYMAERADEDGIYQGTKGGAFTAVGISQTYYSPMFKTLEEMGCIAPYFVGGRGKRYHIRIISTPEREAFEQAWRIVNLTKRESRGTLHDEIEAIRRRLPDVDLTAVLLNLEQRLSNVEKALDKSKGR